MKEKFAVFLEVQRMMDNTVQCDKCLIWQHVKCVLARNNGQPLPDIYYCEKCDSKKNDQKVIVKH